MAIGFSRDGSRSYGHAVASAGRQAAITAAWLAAGELSTGRRRVVRGAIMVAITAVSFRANHVPEPGESSEREAAQRYAEAARPQLSAIATAAALRLPVMLGVGSASVQRRWLARLTRSGHIHPHRSLAVRMGALSFVGSLPAELVEVREARRRGGGISD